MLRRTSDPPWLISAGRKAAHGCYLKTPRLLFRLRLQFEQQKFFVTETRARASPAPSGSYLNELGTEFKLTAIFAVFMSFTYLTELNPKQKIFFNFFFFFLANQINSSK